MEAALLSGDTVFGISVDFAKCFDRIPHGVLLALVEQMGLPPEIARPVRAMYLNLRRRFKIGAVVGEAFCSTNGILAGRFGDHQPTYRSPEELANMQRQYVELGLMHRISFSDFLKVGCRTNHHHLNAASESESLCEGKRGEVIFALVDVAHSRL